MKHFHALIKPASSSCNMRCRYCFYHDVSSSRKIKSFGIMSEATVKALIRCVYGYLSSGDCVTFTFQGGEPTIAGIAFFKNFTSLAEELSNGKLKIYFAIQTNGLLINREWAKFLAEKNFLVGISADGYDEIHNYLRHDAENNDTYSTVASAIKILKNAGVSYNILSVISAQMAKHPLAVMKNCKRNEWNYLQFIPCLSPLDSSLSDYEPPPKTYASFMKKVFDVWLERINTETPVSIRQFDNLFTMLQGAAPEQCGLSGKCTPQFVVEADGSVYPCDFYVLDRYRCGSVLTDSVEQISNSEGMKLFMKEHIQSGNLCKSCPVYRFCKGGCRRYRSYYYREKQYCPYQDFLLYALPKMQNLFFR